MWSVMRRKATCVNHAHGFCGRPSRGHCVAAASDASCTASSAAAKSRNRRTTMPSTCGVRSRKSGSIGGSEGSGVTGDLPSGISKPQIRMAAQHLTHLDGHIARCTTGARCCRSPRCDLIRLLRAFHVNDPVSSQKFFRFREDTVRNRRAVLASANEFGLAGPAQAFRGNKYALILELLAESTHKSDVRLHILLRPFGVLAKIGFRAVHHQNVFHTWFFSFRFRHEWALSLCSRSARG